MSRSIVIERLYAHEFGDAGLHEAHVRDQPFDGLVKFGILKPLLVELLAYPFKVRPEDVAHGFDVPKPLKLNVGVTQQLVRQPPGGVHLKAAGVIPAVTLTYSRALAGFAVARSSHALAPSSGATTLLCRDTSSLSALVPEVDKELVSL